MLSRKTLLLVFILALPFFSFAQKAFETAHYTAKFNGKTIKLKLANGFIGGTEITVGNIIYYANSGRAEAHDQMMFQPKFIRSIEYFVLNNMLDSYSTVPPAITGRYFRGRKGAAIRFKLDK